MDIPPDVAAELVKMLPARDIYMDGAQASVKQTGLIAEDLLKCLHLALAPIQYLAAVQDRYRDFLDRSVRRVPESRRTAPPPQILGPVLEGIRYEPEGSELDEMASNLLSTSMDVDAMQLAHPAFPKIITQLSRDEVILLKAFGSAKHYHIYEQDLTTSTHELGAATMSLINFRVVEGSNPEAEMFFPKNFALNANHLYYLGLAHASQATEEPIMEGTEQVGIRGRQRFELTKFGEIFARACKLIPAS